MNEKIVRVGIGVMVEKGDKVLIGLRLSKSHGNQGWQFPGGHLEFGESFEECAKRETKEETNLDIDDLEVIGVTNDYFEEENKHYVTVFLRAKKVRGEPKVMEKEKCKEWKWVNKEEIKNMDNLFLPLKNLVKEKPHLFSTTQS